MRLVRDAAMTERAGEQMRPRHVRNDSAASTPAYSLTFPDARSPGVGSFAVQGISILALTT